MIVETCQRWREGRARYRPAREVVDVRAVGTRREAFRSFLRRQARKSTAA